MAARTSKLMLAYMEDQRFLAQSFARLFQAIDDGDAGLSAEIAADINQHAGPHIQFEEEVLYPRLATLQSPAYVSRLYREHQIAVEVIRAVLIRPSNESFGVDERAELSKKAHEAIKHCVACGNTMSFLSVLDDARQTEIFEQLQSYRDNACDWIELVSRRLSPSEARLAAIH